MINPRGLAICKRRGHEPAGLTDKVAAVKSCGIWQRTISTIEEREDEPPEDAQSPTEILENMAKKRRKQ